MPREIFIVSASPWFEFESVRVPRHDGHDSGLMADSIPE
jgi:hypothetical protein